MNDERTLIVKLEFGSHLYGLSTPESDRDFKGIVLPSKEDILMGNTSFHISHSTGDDKSKNKSGDVDTEYYSLQRFLELAQKGETVAVDMLHANDSNFVKGDLHFWNFMRDEKHMFYTKNMKSYIGYVRKQAAKYGVKGSRLAVLEDVINIVKPISDSTDLKVLDDIIMMLPIGEHSDIVNTITKAGDEQTFYELLGRKYQTTLKLPMLTEQLGKVWDSYGARARAAKDNDGVDWKAVSHALRAGYQAKHIYEDGGFTYPLDESDFLLAVKTGQLDYITEVQPVLDDLVDEVMVLAENSDYPEKIDMSEWWEWMRWIHEVTVLEN